MSPFSTAVTVTFEFDLDESERQDGKAAGWWCFILKKYRKKQIFLHTTGSRSFFFFLRTTAKRRRTACGFGPPQHYRSHFKTVCGAPRLHLTACYALHVPVSEASSPRTEPGIVRTHPRLAFSRSSPPFKEHPGGEFNRKRADGEENFQEKLHALAILCLTNVF